LNQRQELTNDPYKDFRQAVDRAEADIDLGKAALTIAASDYPNLDFDAYLSRIDALATSAAARLGSDADVSRPIAAINFVLF
jgi:regulator of sirC expression with transglutaminase-like and TPR domain